MADRAKAVGIAVGGANADRDMPARLDGIHVERESSRQAVTQNRDPGPLAVGPERAIHGHRDIIERNARLIPNQDPQYVPFTKCELVTDVLDSEAVRWPYRCRQRGRR